MGYGAGGGLAPAVTLMARHRALGPPPAKQILICPLLNDLRLAPWPNLEELTMWKHDDNITGCTALLRYKADKAFVSEYAAPARARL